MTVLDVVEKVVNSGTPRLSHLYDAGEWGGDSDGIEPICTNVLYYKDNLSDPRPDNRLCMNCRRKMKI